MRASERGRERASERERESERERDIQRASEREREKARYRDKERERESCGHAVRNLAGNQAPSHPCVSRAVGTESMGVERLVGG